MTVSVCVGLWIQRNIIYQCKLSLWCLGVKKNAKYINKCISAINKCRVQCQKLLELLIWLVPLFKKFYQTLIRSLIASVLINLTLKKLITLILTQSISSSNYHFTTISIMPCAYRTNDLQRWGGFTGGECVFFTSTFLNQSCRKRFSCPKTAPNFQWPPVFYSFQSEKD